MPQPRRQIPGGRLRGMREKVCGLISDVWHLKSVLQMQYYSNTPVYTKTDFRFQMTAIRLQEAGLEELGERTEVWHLTSDICPLPWGIRFYIFPWFFSPSTSILFLSPFSAQSSFSFLNHKKLKVVICYRLFSRRRGALWSDFRARSKEKRKIRSCGG